MEDNSVRPESSVIMKMLGALVTTKCPSLAQGTALPMRYIAHKQGVSWVRIPPWSPLLPLRKSIGTVSPGYCLCYTEQRTYQKTNETL